MCNPQCWLGGNSFRPSTLATAGFSDDASCSTVVTQLLQLHAFSARTSFANSISGCSVSFPDVFSPLETNAIRHSASVESFSIATLGCLFECVEYVVFCRNGSVILVISVLSTVFQHVFDVSCDLNVRVSSVHVEYAHIGSGFDSGTESYNAMKVFSSIGVLFSCHSCPDNRLDVIEMIVRFVMFDSCTWIG